MCSINDYAQKAIDLSLIDSFQKQISKLKHINRLYRELTSDEYVNNIIANAFLIMKNNNGIDEEMYFEIINQLSYEYLEKILLIYEYIFYATHIENYNIKFIMSISAIEAVMQKKKHVRFYEWIIRKPQKEITQKAANDNIETNDIIDKLRKEYIKIHGTTSKFKDFINNYLSDSEKQELSDSFEFRKYQDGEFVKRTFDSEKKKINAILDYMYSQRSKFVHESEFCSFPFDRAEGLLYYKKKRSMYIGITTDRFLSIIIKNLFKVIKNQISNRR